MRVTIPKGSDVTLQEVLRWQREGFSDEVIERKLGVIIQREPVGEEAKTQKPSEETIHMELPQLAKEICANERPPRLVLCQRPKGHEGSHYAVIFWENE